MRKLNANLVRILGICKHFARKSCKFRRPPQLDMATGSAALVRILRRHERK